jgi:hypothetical protein
MALEISFWHLAVLFAFTIGLGIFWNHNCGLECHYGTWPDYGCLLYLFNKVQSCLVGLTNQAACCLRYCICMMKILSSRNQMSFEFDGFHNVDINSQTSWKFFVKWNSPWSAIHYLCSLTSWGRSKGIWSKYNIYVSIKVYLTDWNSFSCSFVNDIRNRWEKRIHNCANCYSGYYIKTY